jgi:hypothetical protein
MFENMIDPIIERCRPHAVTLRDQWEMFTTGTIERLDRIAAAVEGDDDAYTRHYLPFNLTSLQPYMIAEVPPGEEWAVEYVIATTAAANGSVTFTPQFDGAINALPVYAVNTPIANQWVQQGGSGYIFPAGSQITAWTAGTTARGMIQLRAVRKAAGRTNLAAGVRNPSPDRTDEADHNGQRHVGSWVPHPGLSRNAH